LHVLPILTGVLHDLGAADEFEGRLAVARTGIEPRVVDRRPSRPAHGIGDTQRRCRRGIRRKVDPYLHLARRIGIALGLQPGHFAIDLALAQARLADRAIRNGDLLGHRGEGRPPFRKRPRLTLFAERDRRSFREPQGEFLSRRCGLDLVVETAALVAERFHAVFELRVERRPFRPRRPRIDPADDEPRLRVAFDPQRRRVEPRREVAGAQHTVALRQVDPDHPRDGGAVGIDDDGIDRRSHIGLRCRRRGERDEAQHR